MFIAQTYSFLNVLQQSISPDFLNIVMFENFIRISIIGSVLPFCLFWYIFIRNVNNQRCCICNKSLRCGLKIKPTDVRKISVDSKEIFYNFGGLIYGQSCKNFILLNDKSLFCSKNCISYLFDTFYKIEIEDSFEEVTIFSMVESNKTRLMVFNHVSLSPQEKRVLWNSYVILSYP